MDEKIIFKKDSSNIKKPYHLKNNVFLLYPPRNVKIEPAELIQESSPLYRTIHVALLHQNLERTKSLKFEVASNACGRKY